MKASTLALLLSLVCGLVSGATLSFAEPEPRRPLLLEGKTSLYQRVITRPTAELYRSPSDGTAQSVPPFTIYYVYNRRSVGGAAWLEVGPSTQPPVSGWLRAADAIDWKQSLTVAFTNPSARNKVLFYRSRRDVDALLTTESPSSRAAELQAEVQSGAVASGSPVIAREPDNHIDIRKQFYLLPILAAEEVQDRNGNVMRALEVASIPMAKPATVAVPRRKSEEELRKERATLLDKMKAGIVFVIDTSMSMDPYIDRTREAMRHIYNVIRKEKSGHKFRFGLVGFRGAPLPGTDLQYRAHSFHNLNADEDPGAVLPAIAGMTATKVSSARFAEDSFAGVKAALDQNVWEPYEGRFIILITDASSLDGSDPLGSTGLFASQLRQIAEESKRVTIIVVHLLTPEGRNDHFRAAMQYKELAQSTSAGALYYPVSEGEVNHFKDVADRIGANIVKIFDTRAGEVLEKQLPPPEAAVDRAIERQLPLVGHAIRLAYLGRIEGTSAPEMFNAWTLDRDLERPEIANLDVRVLLTKNQLSDLRDALKLILDQGRATRLSPQDFFNQLRIAAASMSRDPRQLSSASRQARRLDSLRDLLGEYLEGLPYKSQILELTEDQWLAMGAASEQEVLDTIEAKLRLYEEYNNEAGLWQALGTRDPGDAVYPVPLDALP